MVVIEKISNNKNSENTSDLIKFVVVVVVYHVTIVAIGHGLLKKFWPFGFRLRSTHCREFKVKAN